MNYFISLMNTALENLKSVAGAENHDPFRGHRSTDGETKSRFNCEHPNTHLLADILGTGRIVNEIPGRNGAVVLIVEADFEIGTTVENEPVEENTYTMQMVHGELQPVGEGKLAAKPTKISSWIRTPEVAKDGSLVFVLASVHPGLPDNAGDRSGLIEGQAITGAELLKRGITRVC